MQLRVAEARSVLGGNCPSNHAQDSRRPFKASHASSIPLELPTFTVRPGNVRIGDGRLKPHLNALLGGKHDL